LVIGVPIVDGIVPVKGDKIKLYGNGLGSPVRGIVINDKVVYYRTVEEQEEKHKNDVEKFNNEKKKEFEENREEYDKKYDSLPDVFKKRINRFRSAKTDFRWQYEPYELFVCEEAIKIADALKTEEEIKKFVDLDYSDQKKLVDIDDNHSGNSFGCACNLALVYVVRPEFVEKLHGALVPMVGCEAYGCTHDEVPEEENEG
jgi:predicted GIY-YIG superfamily endonuclease